MTRITIEIPYEKDLNLLLVLIERLNLRLVEKVNNVGSEPTNPENRAFILRGLPAREDFEDFVKDFEASRSDRALPGREN